MNLINFFHCIFYFYLVSPRNLTTFNHFFPSLTSSKGLKSDFTTLFDISRNILIGVLLWKKLPVVPNDLRGRLLTVVMTEYAGSDGKAAFRCLSQSAAAALPVGREHSGRAQCRLSDDDQSNASRREGLPKNSTCAISLTCSHR